MRSASGTLDRDDERRLIEAIGAGDQAAFERFYMLYENRTFRFILTKLNDEAAAADILHEVMLAVWQSAGNFEGRSTLSSWVFGIAYRKIMDRYRRHSREDLVAEVPEQPDTGADQFDAVAAGDEAAILRRCMDGLSASQRAAVEMTFYEDMTYREIADALGCPEGTVKTRLFHAKHALKDCLDSKMGGRT